MSEERNTVPAADGQPEKQSRKSIYPYAAVIGVLVLLALVVMSFLSSQKLHQQVVVLEREISALKESGRKTDGRIQALSDELVVRALRQRRHRIKRALRTLADLQPVVHARPGLAGPLEKLRAGLRQEYEKLGRKLGRKHPRQALSGYHRPAAAPLPGSRSAAAHSDSSAPGHLECANGACRLVPEARCENGGEYSLPVADAHPAAPAPKQASVVAPAAPSPPVAAPPQETWWTRFINLRIFGGN